MVSSFSGTGFIDRARQDTADVPCLALAGSCWDGRWAWQGLMFEGVKRPLLLVVLRDSVIDRQTAVSQRASASVVRLNRSVWQVSFWSGATLGALAFASHVG